jgi:hypothetical protein
MYKIQETAVSWTCTLTSLDRYAKKALKADLVTIDQWGGPGLNGRKV